VPSITEGSFILQHPCDENLQLDVTFLHHTDVDEIDIISVKLMPARVPVDVLPFIADPESMLSALITGARCALDVMAEYESPIVH